MQQKHNIYIISIFLTVLLLISCNKNEQIIPPKTMSRIISEIYLADQYIEDNPKYRAQMDTTYLYEAITQKYGYTFHEYQMATRYYLQDGNSMKKIYIRARDFLTDRKKELTEILKIEAAAKEHYWAIDSANKRDINDLWKEPHVRNIYWLTSSDSIKRSESWRFTDTTTFDTPQNALWWINNIRTHNYDYMNKTLPILTKDYVIRTGRSVAARTDIQRALEERMRLNEETEKNRPEIKKETIQKEKPEKNGIKKATIQKDNQEKDGIKKETIKKEGPEKEGLNRPEMNKELKKPEITNGEIKKEREEVPKTNTKARIKKQDQALSIELKERK